jgi:hypothetical protein
VKTPKVSAKADAEHTTEEVVVEKKNKLAKEPK